MSTGVEHLQARPKAVVRCSNTGRKEERNALRFLLTPVRMAITPLPKANAGNEERKRTLYIADRGVSQYSHYGEHYELLKKAAEEPTIAFLGMHFINQLSTPQTKRLRKL